MQIQTVSPRLPEGIYTVTRNYLHGYHTVSTRLPDSFYTITRQQLVFWWSLNQRKRLISFYITQLCRFILYYSLFPCYPLSLTASFHHYSCCFNSILAMDPSMGVLDRVVHEYAVLSWIDGYSSYQSLWFESQVIFFFNFFFSSTFRSSLSKIF